MLYIIIYKYFISIILLHWLSWNSTKQKSLSSFSDVIHFNVMFMVSGIVWFVLCQNTLNPSTVLLARNNSILIAVLLLFSAQHYRYCRYWKHLLEFCSRNFEYRGLAFQQLRRQQVISENSFITTRPLYTHNNKNLTTPHLICNKSLFCRVETINTICRRSR